MGFTEAKNPRIPNAPCRAGFAPGPGGTNLPGGALRAGNALGTGDALGPDRPRRALPAPESRETRAAPEAPPD